MITVGSVWELRSYYPDPLIVVVTDVSDDIIYIRWANTRHRECGEPRSIFEEYYKEVIY